MWSADCASLTVDYLCPCSQTSPHGHVTCIDHVHFSRGKVIRDRCVTSPTDIVHDLREAIVQRRFIIPILLPDMGLIESRTPSREHAKHGRTNISSGGWQGSRSPTDWWQHPAIARIYDTASDKASARNGDHALSAPRAAASARDGSSLHQRDLSRFAPISIEVQEKLGGYSGPSSNTQEVLLDEVTEALIIARILETIHVPQLPDHNPR